MYLVIGIILAFILSFWKDNRSLWNSVLFLLFLISSYIYLSYFFIKIVMRRFSLLSMDLPLFYSPCWFFWVVSF